MKQKMIFTLLALTVVVGTIAVMQDQEHRQNELRQEAFRSMEALNTPDISGADALQCEANITAAIDARAVSWDELDYSSCTVGELVRFAQEREVRQNAFDCRDRLRSYWLLNGTEQTECAKTVVEAVRAGYVTYAELDAEDEYQTINELANQ